MDNVDVSIILVNYKTSELLKNALDSVAGKSAGFSYETIVVDNSQDKEEFAKLEALRKNNIRLIDAKANLGFGKANNLGAKAAKGRYLYFLNTDTLLINNAIFLLKEFLDSHSDVGVVGSNLYTKDLQPNHSFDSIEKNVKNEKKMLGFRRAFLRFFFGKRYDFNYGESPLEIKGSVIGASLMIRKDLFDRLEGFDKDIFMYAEESLLCYRVIHECNMKIYNVPSAKVIHFGGASFEGEAYWHAKAFADGNYLYYLKAFGKDEALKAMKCMKRFSFLKAQIHLLIDRKNRQHHIVMYQAFKKEIEENSKK